MKKSLLLTLLVLPCMAWSQYHIRLSAEYALGLQKDFVVNSNVSGQFTNQRGSYGNGLQFAASFGKDLSPNTVLLLDFGYQNGTEYVRRYTVGTVENESIGHGSSFSLTPNLMVKADGLRFTPYVRFGVILAVPKIVEERRYTNDPEGRNLYEYRGGLAWGTLGAIGFEYMPGANSVVFIEAVSRNLLYHPQILSNVENYKDFAPVQDLFFAQEPSSATEIQAVSKNFSTLGLTLGVKLNLNLKKKDKAKA